MSDGLRKALDAAQGRSEFIIVVYGDVRGFSAFSMSHESPDVAMYIKRVYMKLIDDYFPFATFHKATGDGLLMTVPYGENDLQERARTTIQSCLRCLQDFPNICSGDPMINFEVPEKIGFGVARGTACCLVSGDTVLDYSGHLLNLTSRLMDLARPSGIVLDGAFGVGLLAGETQKLFEPQDVYIRSVAEDEPTTVYALKGAVEVPEDAKRPLRFEHWDEATVSQSLSDWKRITSPWYIIHLAKRVKRPDGITVELVHQSVRGRRILSGLQTHTPFDKFHYRLIGNEPAVMADVSVLREYAATTRLRGNDTVTIRVLYVPD